MRVAILPTGRTEWHGLAEAFGRLFPDHEFYCLPSPGEVRSYPDRFPYDGFTSNVLTANHVSEPPESACDLVARAAQEALGDRRRTAADLVFIIDDVELVNMHQQPRVVAVMRGAVDAHLSALQGATRLRTRGVLREKVSFHLVAPMIEAWLFADSNALSTAGVPSGTQIDFAAATDPEAFVTHDTSYLAATVVADCPALAALPRERRKRLRPKWLGSQPRCRHPKGYLQWLCRSANERNCTKYAETSNGGPALAGLSWCSVFGRDPAHFALLRALVEDLVDGLACAPSVSPGVPIGSPPTRRCGAPSNAVLRNL